jgi:hypothetical protein
MVKLGIKIRKALRGRTKLGDKPMNSFFREINFSECFSVQILAGLGLYFHRHTPVPSPYVFYFMV